MNQKNIKLIHQTLLNNSLISGVKLITNSRALTETGHGLYIDSDKGDRYADLRSCVSKPFWGHTHPLSVQDSFDLLPLGESSAQWHTSSLAQIESIIENNSFCDFNISALKLETINSEKKLIVKIDQNSLLEFNEDLKEIKNQLIAISYVRPLVIWEINLLPMATDGISFFQEINCESFIELSHPKVFLTNSVDAKTSESSPLINAMLKFYENVVFSKFGKCRSDRAIIDDFIKVNKLENSMQRIGNVFKVYSNNDFLSVGILTDNQFQLTLPCSCTKDELLDTLERIKTILLR